jgi:hypothetical protein
LPVHAPASSKGTSRDTWKGRAGIRIPEA